MGIGAQTGRSRKVRGCRPTTRIEWHAPVVAETYDGGLNDINGFHVSRDHALEAMGKALS